MPDVALLTDHHGRFKLAAPVPGRYRLRCDTDSQGHAEQAFTAAGQTLQLTLNLAR
jgi:hypothetical protein